jgi:hypothetical protein
MPSHLTADFVNWALSFTAWDVGNQVLYDFCRTYPDHSRQDIIIAKVWLIGRTYAAAIERRRTRGLYDGDEFYESIVGPKICSSGIDDWFHTLRARPNDDAKLALETHKKVLELFADVSGLEKRSLASKYLHFHFPDRFYIFDSRATKAISKLAKPRCKNCVSLEVQDDVYARFFYRCRALNKNIAETLGLCLSPRELDKVLLACSRRRDS